MQALYYNQLNNKAVKCELCPHNCVINDGDSGVCNVRTNKNGTLFSDNYGVVSSIGFDPIEKKPLYHFYPGSEILSLGSLGCNLKCKFCQNWQISQTSVNEFKRESQFYDPEKVIDLAKSRKNNVGIAYTYNEPTVFYEFMLETAIKATENNLKNVMVTNGFINQRPLEKLNKFIDAYSVDLKAFHEDFFKLYTKSRLEPVKDTLRSIVKAGKHLEITNLVIPTLNDNEEEFEAMVKWIKEELGQNIVLHISRYYPTYKLSIEATHVDKMIILNQIAKSYLNYVYLGNVTLPNGNNTFCAECNELLIERSGYSTVLKSINNQGDCVKCGNHILNFIYESS